ncbi:hypothetical protein OGAPHI_001949 [Ogataea philodendri]|uniref:Uncharacterized protein n=1 Tax=Ogataea philodendri TaxID=1378263 RepID=A0A9P8T7H9_9ASCO|nr:uncharacterized protein OGAPHI_001949 [Ogataea philodendri]KAH3668195.1 hypothetical protein OGAPHI_001949 [Ogataea philodendri]
MDQVDLTNPESYTTQTLLLISQVMFDCLHSLSGKNFDVETVLEKLKENPLMESSDSWTPSKSEFLQLFNNLMLENQLIETPDKSLDYYKENEPLVVEICERLYKMRISELNAKVDENKKKFNELLQVVKEAST